MYKIICFTIMVFTFVSQVKTQVILSDILINDPAQNIDGVGQTAIAVGTDGRFAVAWQDFNEYNIPIPAMPRVAVQMISADATAIGPLNLFNGESRSSIIYLDDYLTGNIDLEFTPNNTLLVAVQHEGLYDNFSTWVWSWETGIGAVSPTGQIIDMLPGTGVIYWLWANDLTDNGNLRLDIAPAGNFYGTYNGPSYNTDMSAVLIQQFDANANLLGDYYTPHTNDLGPNFSHIYPDIATDGNIHLVVWQDGRQDANYDITAQFYNNAGAIGGNLAVNSGDPPQTYNLWPGVSMNAAGNSVVVWADTREGTNGEIFGQRFNASGQAVGNNFQVSAGEGVLPYSLRPEVAMRNDNSFMVVWTDSIPGVSGIDAYRVRARQFGPNGNPTGSTFILPDQEIPSALACVATNGTYYYCSWLDVRVNNVTLNVFVKVIGNVNTGVEPVSDNGLTNTCQLEGNYPNPVNSSTTIKFSIPYRAKVVLKIFDVSGKELTILTDEELPKGEYQYLFDATDLNDGVYFYQMEAFSDVEASDRYFTDTKKFVLFK